MNGFIIIRWILISLCYIIVQAQYPAAVPPPGYGQDNPANVIPSGYGVPAPNQNGGGGTQQQPTPTPAAVVTSLAPPPLVVTNASVVATTNPVITQGQIIQTTGANTVSNGGAATTPQDYESEETESPSAGGVATEAGVETTPANAVASEPVVPAVETSAPPALGTTGAPIADTSAANPTQSGGNGGEEELPLPLSTVAPARESSPVAPSQNTELPVPNVAKTTAEWEEVELPAPTNPHASRSVDETIQTSVAVEVVKTTLPPATLVPPYISGQQSTNGQVQSGGGGYGAPAPGPGPDNSNNNQIIETTPSYVPITTPNQRAAVLSGKTERPNRPADLPSVTAECDVKNPIACNRNLLEICDFRNGTYRCVCPPNHSRLSDGRCLVVNECFERKLHDCSDDATCTDTLESYVCACKEGFTDLSPEKLKPGRVCKKSVDECSDYTKNAVTCDKVAKCQDTSESYACSCPPGYFDVSERYRLPAGRKCEKDIDPCSSSEHNDCSKNATCTSNKGVYTCQCKSGYSDVSPNVHYPGRDCRPPPEKETTPSGPKCDPKKPNSCPSGERCLDSNQDYMCQCAEGTVRSADNKCVAAESCSSKTDCDPNANCINRPGSYDCECKAAFVDVSPDLNKRGRKCVLPEGKCSSRDKNDCSVFANCHPLLDGFKCQCQQGYLDVSSSHGKEQGRVCIKDKDECSDIKQNSCDENADCVKKPDGYACLCQKGYFDVSSSAHLSPGRVCVLQTNCPAQPSDLIFLVDGSGSIGSFIFKNDVLRFISEFVGLFTVAPDQTRIGMIQFSDIIRKEFDLNQFPSPSSLQRGITNVQYLAGLTHTGAAINYMMKEGFTESHGARADLHSVHRVAVVITDGRAQDDVVAPAEAARKAGVILFAVGVTDHIQESQLIQIAGNKTRVFMVGSFKDLNTRLRAAIQKELCPPSTVLPPNECPGCDPSRNYVCKNGKCVCPEGFCEDPVNKVCGAQPCNPDLSFVTCPFPMVCKQTPYLNYRCACPKDFSCQLTSGECVNGTEPCPTGQKRNQATNTCEGCNPPCDINKNQFCLPDRKGELTCGCKDRYTLDPITQVCTINECLIPGLNNCSKNANCTDTLDSYFCTCFTGYKDNSPGKQAGIVCDKIEDPCKNGKHNCSKDADCIADTLGGFTCKCREGFIDKYPPIPGRECEKNENECEDPKKNNCSKNADCFDLQVGYRCVCKTGFQDLKPYEDPGRFCVIDPCQDASKNDCWLKRCRVVDISTGQFTCEPCPSGYVDADTTRPGRNCQTKVEPCADPKRNDCDPNAYCIGIKDKTDDYTCKCRDGYLDISKDTTHKPGRKCEIIKNPCFDVTKNDCHTNAICTDLLNNNYNCTCKEGYKDKSHDSTKPGRLCVTLVNECLLSQLNNCSANAKCKDLEDGYNCTCFDGYKDKSPKGLPGRVCVFTPDPCSNPSLNECDIHAKCTRIGDDKYKCECLPPYKENSTSTFSPGRHCTYDGCSNKLINTCGHNAECINGDGYINCRCKEGFVDEDPLRPGTKCVEEPTCGGKKCNKTLGLQCNTKTDKCVCKEGWAQRNETSKCVEVVPIDLYLWVVRRNQNIYRYTPDLGNLDKTGTKEIVTMFIDGIGKTYDITSLVNTYVTSKVREIDNPSSRNPNWDRGLWIEFTGYFEKSSAPDDYTAWRTLVDTIKKNFNFSVGGTELYINEYQLPFACYKNTCDKNANCTEITPTSYTCVCFHNYVDLNPENPGRSCALITTVKPTTKQTCGSQICRSYAGEVCKDNRCVCGDGKARRDPNEECTDYDHLVRIPIIVVANGSTPVTYTPNYQNPNTFEYTQLVPTYIKNIDESYKVTLVYPSIIAEGVVDISKPGDKFPDYPNGILVTTEIAVKKGTDDKEVCEQLKQSIRNNNNFIGLCPLKVDEEFDFCNPSAKKKTTTTSATTTTPATTTTISTTTTAGNVICNGVTCKKGQFCVKGRCVDCPEGQWKNPTTKVCEDVSACDLTLWLVRRHQEPLNYNSSYADPDSKLHKETVDWMTVGVQAAYDKTDLGNKFVDVDVHEFSKPPDNKPGMITEFTVYFKKNGAPAEGECLDKLITVIVEQFNYSVGGTPLFINDKVPPCILIPRIPCKACPEGSTDQSPLTPGKNCVTDPCAKNTCDINAQCVPLPKGGFECKCKAGFKDNSTGDGHSGQKCIYDFCADFPDCPRNNGTCINYKDYADCECNKGFTDLRKFQPSLKRTCHGDSFCLKDIDIDYCCLQIHSCHVTAACVRLPTGGYQCRCQDASTTVLDNVACPAARNPSADSPIGARRATCNSTICNSRGDCFYSNGKEVCECYTWYTGEYCSFDIRIILAILFAILFFLITLCCLIYFCLKCRCFRSGTSYREMASSSSEGMSQTGGKESSLYQDFAIPRPKIRDLTVAGGGATGHQTTTEEHSREQHSLERYLESRDRVPSVERMAGNTVVASDVFRHLPAGQSVYSRQERDDYSEGDSGSEISSSPSWQEQIERRVVTDYKKTETTKTTAAANTTAEFHVFPPGGGVAAGALTSGDVRQTTTAAATSSSHYQEADGDDISTDGSSSVGSGDTETTDRGNSFDKKTLVRRAHEFEPAPDGRGGAEKFITEVSSNTKSKETKYM